MSLSCECSDDYDYFYDTPKDYNELSTSKRKRCMSCNTLIDIGNTVVTFPTWRHPKSDVEDRIYGEGGEVPMANKYMCEECGDIFYSLTELGFCVNTGIPMKELLAEYQNDYAPYRNEVEK